MNTILQVKYILTNWCFLYFYKFYLRSFKAEKELNVYRLRNWEKIVRPRVKFFEPIPQLAPFENFFVPLRIWVPQLPVNCHSPFFSKSFQDVEIQTEAYQAIVKKDILPSIIHSERLSYTCNLGYEEEQFVRSHIKRVPFTKVVKSFLILTKI